ncbi:PREDICTED: protein BEX4-like [Chrysochloris asiatica]|uniref:Protein BEX4-like n=1 Tax=Chrysochloris asiatica TaxID=185453 RepID=A0A9B0UAP0_CHRAS|nr:PREDICTED: protein BEX4-like [Chrysochloris asiatica]
MASKEGQSGKNLNVENVLQENQGGEQVPVKNEEEGHTLGRGESRQFEGNVRRGLVWRLAHNFRWGLYNRHFGHSEVGNDVQRLTEQMMEVRRKIKERQMRRYMGCQIPEPDNHDDFCLIP